MGRTVNAILAFGWDLGNVEKLPWSDDEPQPWYAELINDIEDLSNKDDLYHRGIELPPDPWDEIKNYEDGWFYEDYRPGEYSRRETPEFRTWKAENQEAIDARYRAEREARDAAKWTLEHHGSDEYTQYIFTLKDASWTADWGDPTKLPKLLDRDIKELRWAMDLNKALQQLGVNPPEDDPPTWILASYGD